MKYKWTTIALASVLSLFALGLLSGCPPNAFHVLTLMVTPIEGGTIALSPDKAVYFAGDKVLLEAIPNEGFAFSRWIGTGINTTINPTEKRIYADETIVAEFKSLIEPDEGESESQEDASVVKNGGFERYTNNWSQASLTGRNLICDYSSCGDLHGITAATGAWWAWFGNHDIYNFESASLFQEITIPMAEESFLYMDIAIPHSDMPFTFQVLFNGTVLMEFTETDGLLSQNYHTYSADISDFADGRSVVLSFLYTSLSEIGDQSALFLDNVIIK